MPLLALVFGAASAHAQTVALPGPEAHGGEWSFSNGSEFPGAQGGVEVQPDGPVRLSCGFSEGGAYAAAYRSVNPPLVIDRVSFTLRKPERARMTVRVTDRTGHESCGVRGHMPGKGFRVENFNPAC